MTILWRINKIRLHPISAGKVFMAIFAYNEGRELLLLTKEGCSEEILTTLVKLKLTNFFQSRITQKGKIINTKLTIS